MGTAVVVSLISTVVGTVVQMQAQQKAADAAARAANYQAEIAEQNAQTAELYAKDAIKRGDTDAEVKQLQTRLQKSRMKTVLAGSGVLINQDSALDLVSDAAASGAYDALIIRSNAQREAFGFRKQGLNFLQSAELARMRGASAQAAGGTAAFGTLIGGAGSFADKWGKFANQGVPGFAA
jgi:murein L,D-transpeptidase YcbB/YkuD